MLNRYSLHKINTIEQLSFSDIEYSKFKFGDGNIAKKFGQDLAKKFIKDILLNNYQGNQLVVISSPYSFIPTATFFMKNYFVFELNNWLAINQYPVIQETKIHRSSSYSEDYGNLNAKERMSLIGNDCFYIDNKFIENKTLIFLDDIRITGSHENVIVNMLSKINVNDNYYLLYFAELTNHLIEPNFENVLNYAYIDSVFKLNEIVNDKSFCINTRVVKYILNTDHDIFKVFIQDQNNEIINLIINMAIGNSYHNIDSYKSNFNYLQQLSNKINLKTLHNGN
jgi:hypothetical protein